MNRTKAVTDGPSPVSKQRSRWWGWLSWFRKRRINVCLVGRSSVGKTTLALKSWFPSFQRLANHDGHKPPKQPLQVDSLEKIDRYVKSTKNEDVKKHTCKLEVRDEYVDFNINDFRGRWIEEYINGSDLPELRRILASCQLVVFMVSPEEAADEKLMAEISSKYAAVCKELLWRASRQGKVPPYVALVFTKCDDYGTDFGREPRLINSSAAWQAAKNLVMADRRAGGKDSQHAWNAFLTATGADDTACRLLELMRVFCEETAPRAPFFNAYMVAADPESSLWEGWHQRGALQLSSDFYEYLEVTQPPRWRMLSLLTVAASMLLTSLLVLAWGLNQKRTADDIHAALQIFPAGEPPRIGLTHYDKDTAQRFDRAAPTALWGPDRAARQLVLQHIVDGYQNLGRKLASNVGPIALHAFKKDDYYPITLSSEREKAAQADPVVSHALQKYSTDLGAIHKITAAFAEFERNAARKPLEDERYLKYLKKLTDEVQEELGPKSGCFMAHLRSNREERLRDVVNDAVRASFDKALSETFKVAMISILRESKESSLASLGQRYNPYTAEGLSNLDPAYGGYPFLFNVAEANFPRIQAVLVLQGRSNGRAVTYEVDLWHGTVAWGAQPPRKLTSGMIPGDVSLVEFRRAGNQQALKVTYHNREDQLLLAGLMVAAEDNFAKDKALVFTPEDANLKKEFAQALAGFEFPNSTQNPFRRSQYYKLVLREGMLAKHRRLYEANVSFLRQLKMERETVMRLEEDVFRFTVLGVLNALVEERRLRLSSAGLKPASEPADLKSAWKDVCAEVEELRKEEAGLLESKDMDYGQVKTCAIRWEYLQARKMRLNWLRDPMPIPKGLVGEVAARGDGNGTGFAAKGKWVDELTAHLQLTFARQRVEWYHRRAERFTKENALNIQAHIVVLGLALQAPDLGDVVEKLQKIEKANLEPDSGVVTLQQIQSDASLLARELSAISAGYRETPLGKEIAERLLAVK